jgi:choline dehydrogenase-like flavoprotein
MEQVLIIGSGPACAGAALALTQAGIRPLVVDIGARLDPALAPAVTRMANAAPSSWSTEDRTAITRQPIKSLGDGLPEKRAFGSDFPFRDHGQLTGITARPGSHRSLVSGAFGGFSNVWGAQVTTFSPATFQDWPVSFDDMAPHYKAILRAIPFAASDDDLSTHFPLIGEPHPLPPLSERSQRVIDAYSRHRSALRRRGVVMGRARLAMDSAACVRCGLCMTGCPYGYIYSASHTLDRLRAESLVDYRPGLLAVRLKQGSGAPQVTLLDLARGSTEVIEAEKVLVACGAMGTTRLVAGSLELFGGQLTAAESAQFTLPMVSYHPTADPRQEDDFTLNQFNMVIRAGPDERDLSQIHFYTYNPAFLDALPALLRKPGWEAGTVQLLRRLSVAIGYLPSWASPRLRLTFGPAGPGDLPRMTVARDKPRWRANPMLRRVVSTLSKVAPRLDLWPALPRIMFAAGGKTYHFGGTFPHNSHESVNSTDRLGRLPQWPDIHVVDASVFPSVPATTFTLTIMANAHRIATALAEGLA